MSLVSGPRKGVGFFYALGDASGACSPTSPVTMGPSRDAIGLTPRPRRRCLLSVRLSSAFTMPVSPCPFSGAWHAPLLPARTRCYFVGPGPGLLARRRRQADASCPTASRPRSSPREPMIRQPVSISVRRPRPACGCSSTSSTPTPPGLKPVKQDQYLRTDLRPRARSRRRKGPKGLDRITILLRPGRERRLPQVEGLRHRAEPRQRASASATAASTSSSRRTCSSTRTRTTTTCPTATRRCCSPASAWRTRTRSPTRSSGGRTAGSTAPHGSTGTAQDQEPGQPEGGARVPAGHLALPPEDEAVRAVRRGRRQHLRPRLRQARPGDRRHQLGRLRDAAPGPGGVLRQGLRQARPAAQPVHLRLLRPRPVHGLQGRPRHLRRHRLPGRRLPEGVPRPVHRRQPALERDLLAQARRRWSRSFKAEPRRRPADRRTTRGSGRSTACSGPDGCVYVADWYDKRAAHLDPVDNWDKTNGRIYRIEYKGRPKYPSRSTCARRRRPSWSSC